MTFKQYPLSLFLTSSYNYVTFSKKYYSINQTLQETNTSISTYWYRTPESVMDIGEKDYDKDIEYSSALIYFLSKKIYDKYSTKCGMKNCA